MNWIDNADSYICPACGEEVSNPANLNFTCPKCGFVAEKDKPVVSKVMSEQRLIDANEAKKRLLSYYSFVNENTSKSNYTGETLMSYEVVGMIEDCIENTPAIDPETLPSVRELREKLERVTSERNAALKWAEKLKSEKAAAIGELNGVLASVYRLTEFVDDEVHPVVDYGLYLRLRDMVDEVIQWEHADEWCPNGDHL